MRAITLQLMDRSRQLSRTESDGLAYEAPVSDDDRPDAALIDAARSGSEPALAVLFARHWATAERSAYLICHDRDAAQDIAQDAFLAAVGALDRFDARRPFAPWLHRIVVNRAIDWTRMRAARHETPASTLPELPDTPEVGFDGELLGALARLDPDHRAVVVMRYLLELAPGEIARSLKIPRGTVNSRLRRGLDTLSASLDREQIR